MGTNQTIYLTNVKNMDNFWEDLIDDNSLKSISISLPDSIIQSYNLINTTEMEFTDLPKEPDINIDLQMSINYYNKFEILNKDIFDKLINLNYNFRKLNQSESLDCIFLENYLLFQIPGNLNQKGSECIIEVSTLNKANQFEAKYLLMYSDYNKFLENLY